MSLDDTDLPPQVAHQRDREAAEPTWVQMARRQRAEDLARRKADADERAANESPEAEEARWSHRFAASAADLDESRAVYPAKPGVDRRCFGGEVA